MRFLALVATALLFSACSDKSPPTWPSDAELEIETTADSATLTWPVPQDDEGVVRLIVRLGDSVAAELGDGATGYEATGLRGETALQFAVIAVDEAGNRSEPLEGSARTLDGTPPRWSAGAVLEHSERMFRWSAANDTTGVSAYVLRLGDEELTRTTNVMFAYDGDPTGAVVMAVDAAGNESRPLVWREGSTLEAIEEELIEATQAEVPQLQGNVAHPLNGRVRNVLQRLQHQPIPGIDRNQIKNESLEALRVAPRIE